MRILARIISDLIILLIRRAVGLKPEVRRTPRPLKLSDEELAKRYYDAACDYAEAHTLHEWGTRQNLADELVLWQMYEQERIRRRLRTFPLEAFMTAEACTRTLKHLSDKLGPREVPISYAASLWASRHPDDDPD